MGKVKAMLMDQEEIFWEKVSESDLVESDTFYQFAQKAQTKLNGSTLTAWDVNQVAGFAWNEYWSDYATPY
jgi:hypothetical protein|tara:strand:+ start:132 stop:344 length:213 start_codon:yes stop_codon:yes gene_type:complete